MTKKSASSGLTNKVGPKWDAGQNPLSKVPMKRGKALKTTRSLVKRNISIEFGSSNLESNDKGGFLFYFLKNRAWKESQTIR